MWGLLISTILASAVDSLNPIAITQQFVLQGMVKKPKHIWFFILPTGIVNLASGYLAYYGFINFIGDTFTSFVKKYGQTFFTWELILGIAFLIAVCYILQNGKIEALKKQLQMIQTGENKANEEEEMANKIKSVSPQALIALGVGATISELTTALPYFAFLGILFNYQLTIFEVSIILIVYNVIYTMPLVILFFVYIKAKGSFDRLYTVIKTQITKWANILAPTVVGLIGIFLVYHSISVLLK
ncbi:MAG: hypothetical protein K0S61_3040 [Anaerocolumna sp.]|jgi:hypothetical protein|nr:hypothetical protein [Anaerocolumna sp.]